MTYSTQEYAKKTPSYTLPWYYRVLKKYEVHRREEVAKYVPTTGKILDVGCMNGEFLKSLPHVNTKKYGIDVVENHIENAKKNVPEGTFIALNLDTSPLPFEDHTFDTVVTISTLQFVLDPDAVLEETFRVLRPGGKCIVEVPNIAYLMHRFRLLLGFLPRTSCSECGWDGGTLHYFTFSSLEKCMQKYGGRVQRRSGSGVFASLRNWWPQLLCGDMIVVCEKIKK